MADLEKRKLFFEKIKESRRGYFVEYSPPGGDVRFASLVLVFYEELSFDRARALMEAEAENWLENYPIPVMVFACDEKGDTVEDSASWRNKNLIAWIRSDGSFEKHWDLLKDEEIPSDALSLDHLIEVYEGVDYRTDQEVKEQADSKWKQRSKELRIGFFIIFIWAVVVPAAVAIFGWANPIVGLIVTVYALWKAVRQGALMLGWAKPSDREKQKTKKEQRMRHYYYHCERNPVGFRRIVAENVEQDEREQIKREAEELTKPSSPTR